MKKLLGSTLALALLVPAGANAELLKNFKASGSLEVDAVSANNVTDFNTATYDQLGYAQTRLMIHGDWDMLDDVHSRVTIRKNDRAYGSHNNEQWFSGTNHSQSVFDVETYTWIDEAYVKIDKLFGGLDTTLGRQFYGDEGDMVIYFGPKHHQFGMPVTALDAGRFDWNGEKAGVTAVVAKVNSNVGSSNPSLVGTSNSKDVNLMGVDVHVKPADDASGSAYLYEQETVNSNATAGVIGHDKLFVAGLKGKVTMGGAWLKGEIAKNFGENRTLLSGTNPYAFAGNYTGWAAKVDGGAKADLNDVGALTGWGEAAIGSGADNNLGNNNRAFQAIAGDYRPGGIYGRFAPYAEGAQIANPATLGNSSLGAVGTNTLSNRVIIGAGAKITPAALAKLTAGLSWYNYRVQKAASLPAGAAGNKFLGNEYDLDLSWAHSENVSVSAGVGSFQPGRAIIVTNGSAVSPVHLCYTDFSIKF